MKRLLIQQVGNGLHPNETVVAVRTADGRAERLVVSRRSIENSSIPVGYPLGERDSAILVELPRETDTGAWRVWVSKDQLVDVTQASAS